MQAQSRPCAGFVRIADFPPGTCASIGFCRRRSLQSKFYGASKLISTTFDRTHSYPPLPRGLSRSSISSRN